MFDYVSLYFPERVTFFPNNEGSFNLFDMVWFFLFFLFFIFFFVVHACTLSLKKADKTCAPQP